VTPEQIAQVRPRLLEFAGSMLADALPRKDQRAKGEWTVPDLEDSDHSGH
jgi:hypothetical protein